MSIRAKAALPTLLLVLLALLPSPLALEPGATLLLSAPFLLLVPGLLVLGRIRAASGLRGSGRLAAAATLSLAIDALALEALGRIGVTLDVLVPTLAILCALAVLRPVRREDERQDAEHRSWLSSGTREERAFDVLVVALGLVTAVIAARRGSSLGPYNDAGMHLSVIVRAVETGGPVTRSPLLAAPSAWSYADAWHRLLATAVHTPAPSAGDVLEVWHAAGAVAGAFRVLTFALVAVECLPVLPAMVAVVVWAAGARFDELPISSGPGIALLWGALGLALAAFRTGSRKLGWLVALSAAGVSFLHPVEGYLLAAGLCAYGLLRAVLTRFSRSPGSRGDRRSRRASDSGFGPLPLALLVLVAALPGMLASNRVLVGEVKNGALSDPSFELRELLAGVHIVDPKHWSLDWRMPATWLALLLLPSALARGPRPGRNLGLALSLVAVVGLLFPPSAWLVLKLGLPSFLLARAGVLFPLALLAGLGVAALPWLRKPVLVVLISAACLAPVAVRLGHQPSPRQAELTHPLLEPSARALLEELPRGQRVITDLWSADFLPLAGGHGALAGITWHTSTSALQMELRDMFVNPWQTSADALELLRSTRAGWVMLVRWEELGCDWPGYGSGFLPSDAERFLVDNPDAFTFAARTQRMVLYRIRRELPGILVGKDSVPPRDWAGVELPALLTVGSWDVVQVGRAEASLSVTLRAREATRDAVLLAALAVPEGFREESALSRIVRVIRREGPTMAQGRLPGVFRIDHRFFTAREFAAGESVQLRLGLSPAPGTEVYLGPASSLPMFPKPLGPAFAQHFSQIDLR